MRHSCTNSDRTPELSLTAKLVFRIGIYTKSYFCTNANQKQHRGNKKTLKLFWSLLSISGTCPLVQPIVLNWGRIHKKLWLYAFMSLSVTVLVTLLLVCSTQSLMCLSLVYTGCRNMQGILLSQVCVDSKLTCNEHPRYRHCHWIHLLTISFWSMGNLPA